MSEAIVAFLLAWTATYLVHSTLLLGAGLLLERWRPRSLALRERALKLCVLGGLVTASVQVVLGFEPVLGTVPIQAVSARTAGSPLDEPALAEPAERAHLAPASAPARPPARSPAIGRSPRMLPPAEHARAPGQNPFQLALDRRPAGEGTPEELRPDRRRNIAGRVDAARRHGALGAKRHTTSSELAPFPEPRALSGEAGGGLARAVSPDPPAPITGPRAFLGALARFLSSSWRGVVAGSWLLGALLLVGILASGRALFLRSLGRRRLVKEGPLREELDELCARAGRAGPGRVRLTISSSVPGPITLGVLRREICIPTRAALELGPAERRAMLAHELAHSLRRDPAWFHLLALLERTLFFQPLNRIARRRIQDLAEVRCDEQAVRWTSDRLGLASCLAEIAGWRVGVPSHVRFAPAMAAGRSQLGERIERLLEGTRSRDEGLGVRTTLALGGVALVCLAAPGVSRNAAPPDDDGAPPETAAITDPPELTRASELSQELGTPDEAEEERAEPLLPAGFRAVYELVEIELGLLEAELDGLRRDFGSLPVGQRLAAELEAIEQRMQRLRAGRDAMRRIVDAHTPPGPPAASPASFGPSPIHLP